MGRWGIHTAKKAVIVKYISCVFLVSSCYVGSSRAPGRTTLFLSVGHKDLTDRHGDLPVAVTLNYPLELLVEAWWPPA